jgi:hypothetical protein
LIKTASERSGYARRHFQAQVVTDLYQGNARQAARELGWNRKTLSKALAEWQGQFCYLDRYYERGRKAAEVHLPTLLAAIAQIADRASQTDATFQTTQLYTRLSAAAVRQQLMAEKGYEAVTLPCEDTIRRKLNQLGYRVKAVQKSQPLKKIAETDAIFDHLQQLNPAADADETMLRLSWDAKAPVLLGNFARGGVSRIVVRAWDHDFPTDAQKVTPFGLYLPQSGELYLYFTQSKVTSDFIIDCLHDFWATQGQRFPKVRTLLSNQDNGPENHTRRTQFMARLTAFVDHFHLAIHLACYPPYHSKYNPIERVWGALEQHWNGSLLTTLQTVLNFARSLTYKGQQPVVELVTKTYRTGVRLSQKLMAALERRFKRLPGLEKWFVQLTPFFVTQLA